MLQLGEIQTEAENVMLLIKINEMGTAVDVCMKSHREGKGLGLKTGGPGTSPAHIHSFIEQKCF